jgi:hypothetical protein
MIKLKDILNEDKKSINEVFVIDDLIAAGLTLAVPVAFKTVMNAISRRKDLKKWLNRPEIMMMDELVKDDEWVKMVYNDIKNDNDTIKAIKTHPDYVNAKGKKPLGTVANKQNTYDADIVKKWLENPIAEKALESVFKKKYPNIDPTSGKKDIPNATGNITYPMWRRSALNSANFRFVQSLHSGNTINHLNKWAEKNKLEKVDPKKPRTVTEPEKKDKKPKANINKLSSVLPKTDLNKTVKNPDTGRMIKVKSALQYDKDSKVYNAAKKSISKK